VAEEKNTPAKERLNKIVIKDGMKIYCRPSCAEMLLKSIITAIK
jgi:hypothetical protein